MNGDHQYWQKGRDAKYDTETTRPRTDGVRSNGSWRKLTIVGMVFTYLQAKYQAKMNYQAISAWKNTSSNALNDQGGGYVNDFLAREFWRFVQVQQKVAELAQTAIDYPPMQSPASFNLAAVKEKVEAAMRSHEGQ